MRKARSSRMRKVDELLREVLAEEVALLKDPRIGFVTVTGVDTSPDLRRATVYYTVLGDDEERTRTAEGLAHAAPHLQGRLGAQVRIKFTPLLEFRVDPAIDTGLRMGELLQQIGQESEPAPTEGTGEPS